MNINKINNQLQYWHNVNELPEEEIPILIKANNQDDLYFIGKLNHGYNQPLVYPLTTYSLTTNYNLNKYNTIVQKSLCHWYNIVKKWMYLTDLKELIE